MPAPQFVNQRMVGWLDRGIFYQLIQSRHVFRKYQAKGMDIYLHRALMGQCSVWELRFQDTGQVLTIPFEKIAQLGRIVDLGKKAGRQYIVKLANFTEEKPVMQAKML